MPSNRPAVVLHYTGYSVDGGGLQRVIRTLAQGAAWRTILGVSADFRSPTTPRLACWRGPAVAGETISLPNLGRTLHVAWRVRRWLRRGSHRIFHGHSRAGLLVATWLWLLGERRVLATVHVFGRQRWFYRAVRKMSGARLHWLGPAMAEYYGEPAGAAAEYLPDCVPATALRQPAQHSRKPITFGCAGNLVPVKNWGLVVQALARMPADTLVRVRHAGTSDGSAVSDRYAAELRRLAERLGVSERITWLGGLDDMGTFYESVDCLIVASRLEASSVAALEAIAAGVPVLAPAGSGTRDLLAACQGGWTFADDSVAALAEKMTALATGAELTGWRRDEGGLTRFLAPRVAETHLAVYRRVLNS